LNKGIKAAKGKYIAFLHSDDFYHNKDAVSLSVEALEKNSGDFSYSNFIMIDENGSQPVSWGYEKFLYIMPFGHPTMFAKTSVLKIEGGFNEKYKTAADYDLIIKLILKDYKGVYVNDPVVTYRYGGLCCNTDYSDEIAEIYVNNYSAFYKGLKKEQAKKIMYSLTLPSGFISSFKKYAKEKKFKNIDANKIVTNLLNDTEELPDKNDNKISDTGSGIPVFLSSDNDYAPLVATTIYSILDHTKQHIDFYILDDGISIENVEKIRTLSETFSNFSIEFIEVDTDKYFKDLPTRAHFTVSMYTRFLIPKLKPKIGKAIYSDVDVIFNGDINELFEENLEGKPIGAVPFTYAYLISSSEQMNEYRKRLGFSSSHEYFESGLLIIDFDLWRKNNLTEKLINCAKNSPPDIFLNPDQDIMNVVFDNNYKKLDNKYIVVPSRTKYMQIDQKTRHSIENPFIIHYAGYQKPWTDAGMVSAHHFWKYARKTIFYEELLTGHKLQDALSEIHKIETVLNNSPDSLWYFLKKDIKKILRVLTPKFMRPVLKKIYFGIKSIIKK
jgi:lipopolysaccharide biosynthesis glycosyltransferase